ncbi:hypothetical protein BGZ97_009340, partial [Linnemannia gamsii]
MHDDVALANRINGLPFHPIAEEIEAAFMEYKAERINWVNAAFSTSRVFRNMAGQSLSSTITRNTFKYIPGITMRRIETRQFYHRSQVAFLPLADDKGTFRPAHQPSFDVKTPQENAQSSSSVDKSE